MLVVYLILAAASIYWRHADGVSDNVQVVAGFLYSCELTETDFFSSTGNEVEYSGAVSGRPGLPAWLDLIQTDSLSPGYFYGTPLFTDVGSIILKISATNQLSFVTETRVVNLNIVPANGTIKLATEFYLTNYNTDEFLTPGVLNSFREILKEVFGSSNAEITRVIHPTTRGISIPAPPAKHGVVVAATPGVNVEDYIPASAGEAETIQGQCGIQLDLPPQLFTLFTDSGFEVDWCKFQVYSGSSLDEGETLLDVGTDDDNSFVRRPSVKEGSVVPFVVIVVVCGVFLLISVIALSCIFCGGRKQAFYVSRKKRLQKRAVFEHTTQSTSGPKTAQLYLRDLAQLPRRRPLTAAESEDEQTLEPHQLPELERQCLEQRQRDPPPYTYPQDLLRLPLQSLSTTAPGLPAPQS